jgi:hypothetical protein
VEPRGAYFENAHPSKGILPDINKAPWLENKIKKKSISLRPDTTLLEPCIDLLVICIHPKSSA